MISRRKFLEFSAVTFITTMTAFTVGCQSQLTESTLPIGAKVMALGDSLTYGYGVGGLNRPEFVRDSTI